MIEIIYKNNNNHIEFSSKGHADFDKIGKDIICSAVSSIIIGGLNAIKEIDSFQIKIEKGDAEVKSLKPVSEHDNIVFETMLIQLKTIEENYPKNLKVIRRE